MIYLLKVEIQFEELQEKNLYYSNIYSRRTDAKNKGIKWLEEKIEYYKKQYENLKKLSIEQMVENKKIKYSFIIKKIPNLNYAESFRVPENEYECRNLRPTYIEYHYNHNGEEKYWLLQYKNFIKEKGYSFIRYPGDEKLSAGTEFAVGNFVVLKDEPAGPVFVVTEVPEKHNPKKFFVNLYKLATIENGKIYSQYEFYGGQLQKYEEEIQDKSLLMLLSKIYKGEVEVREETLRKLEAGEILLNEKLSYKEIEELN